MSENTEKMEMIYEDSQQNLRVYRKNKAEYIVMMGQSLTTLVFHSGPLRNGSVQGLTNEAMLAILISRTRELDNIQPAKENKLAVQYMVSAIECFKERTARCFKELMSAASGR